MTIGPSAPFVRGWLELPAPAPDQTPDYQPGTANGSAPARQHWASPVDKLTLSAEAPTDTYRPMHPVGSMDVFRPMHPDRAVDVFRPMHPVGGADAFRPIHPEGAGDTFRPVHPDGPTDTLRPMHPVGPADAFRPMQPVDPQPAELRNEGGNGAAGGPVFMTPWPVAFMRAPGGSPD